MNIRFQSKSILRGAALTALIFTSPLVAFEAQADLKCEYLKSIVDTIMKEHLLFDSYNANIENRSIDQYIKSLDPAKIYLLEADVKSLKKSLTGIYKKLDKRDCKVLDETQKLIVKRVEERAAFAESYLGKSFKFNPKIELILDADHREVPKNETQAKQFQEKYLQWQVANFLATDMKQDEAKEQIIRRYKRAVKSLKDQKQDETYANYLDAVARSLDPHSGFLSQDNLEDFEIQMRLSLEGIGATLSNQDGYTVIEQLIPGGAAQSSGLLENQDKIVAVGQDESGGLEPIIDLPLRDVVKLIRGKKGTKVRLSILRKKGDKNERFVVTLARSKINLEQEAAHIIYIDREVNGVKKKYGVIDLPSFYQDTRGGGRSCYEDVKKLLAEAEQNKVDGVVLDLASNGGGSLDDAVKLSGLFFRKGAVVKTQGSRGQVDILAANEKAPNYGGPLVVLTSRLSASASEIVAGALKDYRRAVVVGADHTFGKGSVQSVVPLPSRLGAIKVTIGMFFVPGGNSTQHRGVEADVVIPGPYSSKEVGERSLDYSLPPKSITPFLSPEAYITSGEGAWRTVEPDVLTKIVANSRKRVGENEEFKKIIKELREAETKTKTVKLEEIISKKDEVVAREEKRKKAANDPNLKKEEYLKRPDVQEALNVLQELTAGLSATPSGAKASQSVKNM